MICGIGSPGHRFIRSSEEVVDVTWSYLRQPRKKTRQGDAPFILSRPFLRVGSLGWADIPIRSPDHGDRGDSLHVTGMGFAALDHDSAVDGCGLDLRSTAHTKDAVTVVPGALSIVTDVAFADDGHIF